MSIKPPVLPMAGNEYSRAYMDSLIKSLDMFFRSLGNTLDLDVDKLNFTLKTLPTQADLADLRAGDVYLDTTAGNVLKVKL